MSDIVLSPKLRERLVAAERAVVFTGAGVSQESGLATFRGDEGLWERFRPEELATPEAFARHPEVVWRWYAWRHGQAAAADPNPAHDAIARLEVLFPSLVVVTQNVDGLHQRAGSQRVLEVHGSLVRARCHRCGKEMEMHEALERSPETPLRCACDGLFRPGVVWFGEPLPRETLEEALHAAEAADVFLSVGTSARVFPAAGVIEVAHRGGAALIEANPEPTAFSRFSDLRLTAPAGKALPPLVEELARWRSAT